MTDSHKIDRSGFAVDGIDDSIAPDTVFPQPFEFTAKRLAALRIGSDGTNR